MLVLALATSLVSLDATEPASALSKLERRECRTLVEGMSRSGDVTICRTRADWRKRDLCRGATRFCTPARKAALYGKRTAFAMTEDARIVCRVLRGTGSRLSSQNVCLPQREWQRMFDEGRAAATKMLDPLYKSEESFKAPGSPF